MFTFIDRLGNRDELEAYDAETVESVLSRHRIPPPSVLVIRDGEAVPDVHLIDSSASYEAHLIEGYDIASIKRLFSAPDNEAGGVYLKRRFLLSPSGGIDTFGET